MNGEQRSGTYDPNMEYITYDEAMILRNQQQQNTAAEGNATTATDTEPAQTAQ